MRQSGCRGDIYQRPLCYYYHRTMYVFSPSSRRLITTHSLSIVTVETSAIPGITGCYETSGAFGLFLPFLLLFAFELGASLGEHIHRSVLNYVSQGLASLTVVCAIQSWRTTSNRLLTVLLTHNVFYYACGLCESAFSHTRPFFHAHFRPESLFCGKRPNFAIFPRA
jgi:hypothetical protein